ncbi:MAG: hypothetical protein ABI282_05900 [Candidatus Baltobacteraceae bacterium]
MPSKLPSALLATLLLAACGGGGGATLPSAPGSGNGQSTTAQNTRDAIATADSVGSSVKSFANFESAQSAPVAQSSMTGPGFGRMAAGGCPASRVKFYVPDLNNDQNSSETIYYYDASCTQIARDSVRAFTSPMSSSEIVQTSEKQYPLGGGPMSAQRADINTISNTTFDANGYPSLKSGYNKTSTGFLNVGSTKTIIADYELVMQPQSKGLSQFCSDQAGFNALPVTPSNMTFGWAGQVAGGSRTANSDGSVTWTATHIGSAFTGPVGSLNVALGTQSSKCPLSSPILFSLSGGKNVGNHTIPVVATYKQGLLTNLSISNAQLSNGLTLSVVTNPAVLPQDANFITGSVSNKSGTLASFGVDAFGDGTLTVVSSGTQYAITDWHVSH